MSIFFALSGFLITYLLLDEKRRQEINIKNFYIRRMLRIWPLYYIYLILSIVTIVIFDLPFESQSLFFYLFLLANVPFIFGGILPFLGHYWSIGVEEQFYSFWPWVIKKSESILTITVGVCISLFLLKCIFRLIDIKVNQGEMNWPYLIIHVTRFHCLLIGAIGAILYFKNNALFLRLTNNFLAQSVSWLVILLVTLNKFHVASFLDNELISLVTVFIIIGQIHKTKRILNLDYPILDFVGKISYGIYVIHPLVIFYLTKAIALSDKTDFWNYLLVYFSVFSVTILIAYLSYQLIEKRFLELKGRYSTVRSS